MAPGLNYTELLIFVAIIAVVLGRRLLRQRKGAKYSVRGIFMVPMVYIALTAFLVFGLVLWKDVVLVVAVVIGAFAGLALGKRSSIFEQDGKVMYRRSVEVMAIWMVGYIIRIGIDFFFNPEISQIVSSGNSTIVISPFAVSTYENGPIIFGADLLLAFSAGLLLGEAMVLYRSYNAKYKPAKP